MESLVISNLVLWLVVIALAVVVLALARQIGVLHERLGPAGALSLAGGIAAGERVPPMELPTLQGEVLSLERYRERARAVLVYFLSPTCPVCKSLLPVVRRLAREEADWLDVLLASDGGTAGEHQAYQHELGLEDFPYVLSRELGVAFQVGRLPYAVLIDERGVLTAKGLVNNREHLESLLEARRLRVTSINDYLSRQAEEEKRA